MPKGQTQSELDPKKSSSAQKGIAVDVKQVEYVKIVAQRSLWMVIALHLLAGLKDLPLVG